MSKSRFTPTPNPRRAAARTGLPAVALSALLLGACGTYQTEDLLPDRRADYRTSPAGAALEVPPDLTSSTIDDTLIVPELNPDATANLSDYASERRNGSGTLAQESVLLQNADFRIERDGSRRWLAVDRSPTDLWQQVKAFWTEGGFKLERADPNIGIMETDWLENRADIPDGPIRAVLKQYLDFAYSAPTRDRFRVRLEASADGSGSELYLTHYGVEEVPSLKSGDALIWQTRPRDPELEAEMLNRLMVYLGAEEKRARAALEAAGDDTTPGNRTRYVDTDDGYRALVIEDNYDRVWRLVGLALDGSDYAIEDQNRAEGLYLIARSTLGAKPEDEGLLSKLAFWGDSGSREQTDSTRYRVRLAGRGPETLVVVQNDQGQPEQSPVAEEILSTVQDVAR